MVACALTVLTGALIVRRLMQLLQQVTSGQDKVCPEVDCEPPKTSGHYSGGRVFHLVQPTLVRSVPSTALEFEAHESTTWGHRKLKSAVLVHQGEEESGWLPTARSLAATEFADGPLDLTWPPAKPV